MKSFGEIMFTQSVQAEQKAGSRETYAKIAERPAPEGLGPPEAQFIAARDSFYIASVSETGWPYVQHRGGPTGFLKVLGPTTLGFADYRGNRQFVSTGNLKADDRVSLFLMDYPNKARLKVLGRARIESAGDTPDLAARLAADGQGRVERLFMIEIEAFDWNCPQFITPRFTETDIREAFTPQLAELERLKAENADLKARLDALGG